MYKPNEVSKITGVTIRTLHYYDKIGLLIPSVKNEFSYRLYSEDDLEKLYQILIYKELEIPLKEIKNILLNSCEDISRLLENQKKLIIKKRNRMNEIIKSIDIAIQNQGDSTMNKDKFKPFSEESMKKHNEEYQQEAENKYGKSDAYNESKSKTSEYSKDDWNKIMNEANEIYIELANLMDREVQDEQVQKVVQKWRNHISTNYYNCTIEIFRGLAMMYVGDERFTKNIDKYGVGLAQFLSDSMNVYCDNNSN